MAKENESGPVSKSKGIIGEGFAGLEPAHLEMPPNATPKPPRIAEAREWKPWCNLETGKWFVQARGIQESWACIDKQHAEDLAERFNECERRSSSDRDRWEAERIETVDILTRFLEIILVNGHADKEDSVLYDRVLKCKNSLVLQAGWEVPLLLDRIQTERCIRRMVQWEKIHRRLVNAESA